MFLSPVLFLSFSGPGWRLSPLFYQDGQIFYFPAPIRFLGELGLGQLLVFRESPIPAAGDALLRTHDAQIKFGATQGPDADTVALSRGLDVVLGALAAAQVIAQPTDGELAQGKACADGPVRHEFPRSEVAGSSPGEGAGVVDNISQRRSEAA